MGRRNADAGGEGLHSARNVPENPRPVKTKRREKSGGEERPWARQGEFLRVLRKQRGFKTQKAFAQALGVAPTTVADWERGVCVPSAKSLNRIAENLRVTAEQLQGGSLLRDEQAGYGGTRIPIKGSVAAGDADTGEVKFTDKVLGHLVVPSDIFGLKVVGDSMSPLAYDGQLVLCDQVVPKPGDLVVCEYPDGHTVFRRLELVTEAGTLILNPVNPRQGKMLEVKPHTLAEIYRVRGIDFFGG